MKLYPPLPVLPAWAPRYLAVRPDWHANRDFAFTLNDRQGMRDPRTGARRHGAVDWFAPAGSIVVSPVEGRVVRYQGSNDISGPVYGGVVAIRCADGLTIVMRHVLTIGGVEFGDHLMPGDEICTVSPWDSGWAHLHMEIWKDSTMGWGAGYRIDNCLDPIDIEWSTEVPDLEDDPAPRYYFEELPYTLGGIGPEVFGPWQNGVATRVKMLGMKARGRKVSTHKMSDGYYIFEWSKEFPRQTFRFGPWEDAKAQERRRMTRSSNTGRKQRPFADKARSLYPWPN